MSLDISLMGEAKKEIVKCNYCGASRVENIRETFFKIKIIHHLNKLAKAAGVYKVIWWPEYVGITTANQLIEPLKIGLQKLKDNPDFFKTFNSPNGYGTYKYFVPWVSDYLDACINYPNAVIDVSR